MRERRVSAASDLKQVARYLPEAQIGEWLTSHGNSLSDDVDFQLTLFQIR